MRKFIGSLFLLAVLVLSGSSLYAFGIPKISNPVSSGDSGNIKEKVDTISDLSEEATSLYNNSILQLNDLLSTKEEKAQLKAKYENLIEEADVSEDNAIPGEVITDAASNLEELSKQQDLSDRIDNLSNEQKKKASYYASNIILANLKFVKLASESKSVVKEVSMNPKAALTVDVNKLKTIAKTAPKLVTASAKATTSVTKIMKSSKIKFYTPKTDADKARPVEDFSFEDEE